MIKEKQTTNNAMPERLWIHETLDYVSLGHEEIWDADAKAEMHEYIRADPARAPVPQRVTLSEVDDVLSGLDSLRHYASRELTEKTANRLADKVKSALSRLKDESKLVALLEKVNKDILLTGLKDTAGWESIYIEIQETLSEHEASND